MLMVWRRECRADVADVSAGDVRRIVAAVCGQIALQAAGAVVRQREDETVGSAGRVEEAVSVEEVRVELVCGVPRKRLDHPAGGGGLDARWSSGLGRIGRLESAVDRRRAREARTAPTRHTAGSGDAARSTRADAAAS